MVIYIPLAFGDFIFSNIIGYFKKIKIKILHRKTINLFNCFFIFSLTKQTNTTNENRDS